MKLIINVNLEHIVMNLWLGIVHKLTFSFFEIIIREKYITTNHSAIHSYNFSRSFFIVHIFINSSEEVQLAPD